MCMSLTNSLLRASGGYSTDLRASLSDSVPRALAASVSPDPYLHSPTEGVCQALPQFPLSELQPRTSLKAASSSNEKSHLVGFLSLGDYCVMLPDMENHSFLCGCVNVYISMVHLHTYFFIKFFS